LTYAGASGTGAITVKASNVVLDLNGFSLTGTGNPTFNGQIAINVASQTNVTVQNGTVTGFTNRVAFNGGAQELVQNLRLFSTTISVTMQGSSFSTIQNCFIVGTGDAGEGVELVDCSGVVVKNNQIANAGSAGASTLTNGNIFTKPTDKLLLWLVFRDIGQIPRESDDRMHNSLLRWNRGRTG
jgi:hypothetical protein